jgi:hypothetical protein
MMSPFAGPGGRRGDPRDDRSKGVAKYQARDSADLEGVSSAEFKPLEVTDASE